MKTRKAKIKRSNALVHANKKARQRLGFQFPAASSEDIKEANKPKTTAVHFTIDNKTGKEIPIHRPKDQFFRKQSEGRIKGVMPKMKKITLKQAYWTHKAMVGFFRNNDIIAGKENRGWFITMTKPGRVVTAEDQLSIMMDSDDKLWLVGVNPVHKHLVIDDLNGSKD